MWVECSLRSGRRSLQRLISALQLCSVESQACSSSGHSNRCAATAVDACSASSREGSLARTQLAVGRSTTYVMATILLPSTGAGGASNSGRPATGIALGWGAAHAAQQRRPRAALLRQHRRAEPGHPCLPVGLSSAAAASGSRCTSAALCSAQLNPAGAFWGPPGAAPIAGSCASRRCLATDSSGGDGAQSVPGSSGAGSSAAGAGTAGEAAAPLRQWPTIKAGALDDGPPTGWIRPPPPGFDKSAAVVTHLMEHFGQASAAALAFAAFALCV